MKILIKIYIFLIFNLAISNVYADAKICAQPLIESHIGGQTVILICEQLGIKCISDKTKLYRVKGSTEPYYYLIDPAPSLFKLHKVSDKFTLLDQWKFKDYKHSHDSTGDEDGLHRTSIKIYPALYPLNKTEFSIAIIDDWFVGYSGGGRSEQYADFIKLSSNGEYKLAIADQLFYSSEMIRACFSEKDYQIVIHCHDESGTLLSIKFQNIGQKYYQWIFNYTDYNWPSNVPETQKKTKKYSTTIIPFRDLK